MVCPVCDGSGELLEKVCDGLDEETERDEVLKQEAKQAEATEIDKQENELIEAGKEEAESATPKKEMKPAETPTAPKEEAKSAIPNKFAVSVVRLNGDVILHNAEVGADEPVGVLKNMNGSWGVWLCGSLGLWVLWSFGSLGL